ncbi:TonB-dependent receptor [Altericroceibacterium xinjiangense]|uniref:TonB-dependent receptor n=1 Tax=Altericroceibacterium xinjiangense TaxID=762261 RepID=UPI0013DF8210|nr:TonB-dependent receptor [Altericroceibacterium xinjiangense]
MLAFVLLSPIAAAQVATEEGDPSPEPAQDMIVVTAQFREQSIQDTPLAITAVSDEMLQARSQTDIADVTAQAPNVTLKPSPSNYGPSLTASIRGIGQYDFSPALEPGVGVYVDDVYYATVTGSVLDLLDLQRVEILRGPQGTLAGKNSIGGAIKLYSRKPEGIPGGYATVAYGSRNRIDLRVGADFALTDNLFARITGVSKQQDGYVERRDYGCLFPESGVPAQRPGSADCVLAKEGEVNYQAARIMLRYEPSDTLDATLAADYSIDDRTVAGSVLTAVTFNGNQDNVSPYPGVSFDQRFVPPSGSYYNYATYESAPDIFTLPNGAPYPLQGVELDGRSKLESWGVSANINLELSNRVTLDSITAYRTYSTSFDTDGDLSPLAVNMQLNEIDYWQLSQELRLNGTLGAANEIAWTLGAFYFDQKSELYSIADLRPNPVPLQFAADDVIPASTEAVFGHISWAATNALTFNIGLRYTTEEKDYTFGRANLNGSFNPFVGALEGASGSYSGDRVDYRLNAQYEFTPDIMGYAQFATGFKGGGVSPRPFNPEQARPFDPETLDTYELGFKSQLFDRRIRFNAAGFYSEYNDIILTLLTCPQFGGPGPCALSANAGDAEIMGLEAELYAEPIDDLLFDASASWLDFQYTRINPDAGGIPMNAITPYTPEWKWSVGIQYKFDFDGAGSVTPRYDMSYQGEVFTRPENLPTSHIDDYILANARLTWRNADADWEASLAVTNLFDKYYYLTIFDLTNSTAGFASGQPGRPREWVMSVKKYF